jgi:hypothetical protein
MTASLTLNRRRALGILGTIVVLIGIGLAASEAWLLYTTENSGLYLNLVSESPTTRAAAIQCPDAWALGNEGAVRVTLNNPTTKPMAYKVVFSVYSDHDLDNTYTVIDTIPAAQNGDVSSPLTGPSGRYYQFASLYAYSDDDLALPGPFHMWPTSYRASCGVRLTASPSYRTLALGALLSPILVVIGAALSYFAYRPQRGLRLLIGGIAALVVLGVEIALLVYILGPSRLALP